MIDCALDLAEQYGARVHALRVVDSELAEIAPEEDREQLFEWGGRPSRRWRNGPGTRA